MNFRELDELIKFGETEFRRLRGIPPLPQAVVEKLCIELRLSPEEFCDTFSRRVAREYAVGNLPFEIADAAMNALEGYAQFVLDADLPPYSWEFIWRSTKASSTTPKTKEASTRSRSTRDQRYFRSLSGSKTAQSSKQSRACTPNSAAEADAARCVPRRLVTPNVLLFCRVKAAQLS